MPYKRRAVKKYRKRAIKRRPRGNPNALRALARTNYARISETRIPNFSDANPDGDRIIANKSYNYQFSLAGQIGRVADLAALYQEFRMTKVEFRFKSYADTVSVGATTPGVQLYMVINRDGDEGKSWVGMLREGINPVSLNKDGNKTMTWRPTVVYKSETSPSIIKTSPWMNTQDAQFTGTPATLNTTPHYGLNLLAELSYPDGTKATNLSIGRVEVELHFEFRRPFYTDSSAIASVVHKL